MDAVEIIEATLVPMVILSGSALIMLSLQQRYGRVIDRIRMFHEQMLTDSRSEWKKILTEQQEILIRRGKLLRNSLSFLMICILSALLSTVFISIDITSVDMDVPALVLFGFSIAALFIAMVFALIEVFISYKAVLQQHDSIRKI